MSLHRIKKNDVVMAIRGAGKGKTGKVLQCIEDRGRAVVEGLNVVKKTVRKSQDRPSGGIVDKEAPIAVSNLLLFCPQCKKGVKVRTLAEGDKKVRKCKKCSHSFDG